MISNSGGNEFGGITGGREGDQTGREWWLIPWYNRPWNCILRHPDENVRNKIAELAEKAAQNNNIGYDQNRRNNYWYQLKTNGYDPSKIKVPCSADCSAGVIANTKATGYILGIQALKNINATYTGNMRSSYRNAGFQVLTDNKYLTSDKYLLRGDILLNDVHHVATNLTNGAMTRTQPTQPQPTQKRPYIRKDGELNKNPQWVGRVTATELNVRTWAGVSYPQIKSYPILKQGSVVDVCDKINGPGKDQWYYVRIAGKYYGFVHSAYIEKA